jgi:large subunit ribosomal protein L37Ae
MGNTKKVGVAGRFGSRYGRGIRKRVIKVEEKQKNLAPCPSCGFKKMKRLAAGLFECKKCGVKFTGGAYETETLAGITIRKMVAQKSFAAAALEELQKESSYADIEREVEKALDSKKDVEITGEETPVKKKSEKTRKTKKVKEEKEADELAEDVE